MIELLALLSLSYLLQSLISMKLVDADVDTMNY